MSTILHEVGHKRVSIITRDLYALQILDKFTLGQLYPEWKDIDEHKGMNGALGFPDLR